jgi:hypothetical protein
LFSFRAFSISPRISIFLLHSHGGINDQDHDVRLVYRHQHLIRNLRRNFFIGILDKTAGIHQ